MPGAAESRRTQDSHAGNRRWKGSNLAHAARSSSDGPSLCRYVRRVVQLVLTLLTPFVML